MGKTKKKNTKIAKDTARPFQVMCTDIYLLWILIVFPLYYADGYFHLPEKKSIFWCTSTLIYLGVILFGVIVTAFSMREHWSFENFKKNITMTDVFMFGFLVCNLIALAISDDRMNAWIGQSSRYYGAKVLILACLVYFVVSRYGWINKVFIWAFLIGGNGVCLLATFDYFGMDVLGINKQMQRPDWAIFISTMGNSNTCASYVCMALVGAMIYFCVTEEKKDKVFSGISIMNCAAALITSRSDSAFVGVAVIIAVLGVMAFCKKIEFKKYILMLAFVDAGILSLFIFRKLFFDKLLGDFDMGLPRALNQPVLLGALLIVLAAIFAGLVYIEKKSVRLGENIKKISIVTAVVGGVIIVVFIVVKLNIIDLFKEGLGVQGEEIPGNRSYTYNRTMRSYMQLPIKNKIFGNGQGSVSSVLSQYFGDELSGLGISINSAHNNILDYLIITGLFGAVCYLGVVISEIRNGLKAFRENPYVLVFLGCIIAYFAQGLFNIEQSNTTTVFWLLLACCEGMYRQWVIKRKQCNVKN